MLCEREDDRGFSLVFKAAGQRYDLNVGAAEADVGAERVKGLVDEIMILKRERNIYSLHISFLSCAYF
jgi:hypothetical protein